MSNCISLPMFAHCASRTILDMMSNTLHMGNCRTTNWVMSKPWAPFHMLANDIMKVQHAPQTP
jgi:hypothetical protein